MISRNLNKPYRVVTQLSAPPTTTSSSNVSKSFSTFNNILNNGLRYSSNKQLSLQPSFIKNTSVLPPASSTSIINTTIQSNKIFNELKRYTTTSPQQPNNSNNSNNNKNINEIKQQQEQDKKDNSNNNNNNKQDNDNDNDDDDDKVDVKKLSTGEKIKYLLKKYGKIALVVHFGVYFITMGSFYALFSSGVDVSKVLEFLHLPADKINPSLGAFAVAFACTKLSTFIRTPLTLITVPIIARYLGRVPKK